LNSPLSESSATFSEEFNVMYFTRTLHADEKVAELQKSGDSLKSGIFQASETSKGWILTREFPFNTDDYSLIQPSLSPDGKKLFFASTMTGGYGGYDIYFSEYINGSWKEPKNLGPAINTRENEVCPFLHQNGRLYFSSRGHNTQGGLDIFYSEVISGEWITPINLPKPFNSRKDEFGYVLSPGMDTGYFASNRVTSVDDDIYMFVSSFPMFKECNPQVEESFCYEFNETGSLDLDTTTLKYEWDFGDGQKQRNVIANHCYSNVGTYFVSLNVIDTLTGDVYYSEASYDLLVQPKEQPFITAPDTVFVNDRVSLDGNKSVIRSFVPNNYYWDFGDGNIELGNQSQHTYNKAGTYYIRLGITAVVDDPEADIVDYSNRSCSQKQILVIKKTGN